MIRTLKTDIISDYMRYGKPMSLGNFLHVYIVHPGFRVTLWYRVSRRMKNIKRIGFLSKLATLWLLHQQLKAGITLNPGTEIGPGLYIPHPGCIVVNPDCVIGSNVYLSHDVLIGKAHSGPRFGVPVVGDGVFIGAGARLLGKLTVGDNAAIGANAVVLSDVPPHTFSAGAPARVVKYTGADVVLGKYKA